VLVAILPYAVFASHRKRPVKLLWLVQLAVIPNYWKQAIARNNSNVQRSPHQLILSPIYHTVHDCVTVMNCELLEYIEPYFMLLLYKLAVYLQFAFYLISYDIL